MAEQDAALLEILNEPDDPEEVHGDVINVEDIINEDVGDDMAVEDVINEHADKGKKSSLNTNLRGVALAEAKEQRLSGIGNFDMIAPLRSTRHSQNYQPTHGILRLHSLDHLSKQLQTETNKRIWGLPTCVVIFSKFIAIGTSHGQCLIFDHFQDVKSVLGVTDHDYGAVAAIDMTAGCEMLCAGHAKGVIVVWDIVKGTPLKVISDIHTCAILHVRFSPSHELRVVTGDIKGVVNMINISQTWLGFTINTQCLLDGSVGQIYCLSLLLPGRAPHPTNAYSLVAMSSAKTVFVVCLEPRVQIVFKLPRPQHLREGALPYLAWRRVMVRERGDHRVTDENVKALDPILVVAWGRDIQLLQVVPSGGAGNMEFISIGNLQTDSEIVGIEWLGEQVLVFMNAKDQVRILDPFAQEELESLDVRAVQMVYHTNFLNIYNKPEMAFHNTFRACDSILYLLGIDRLVSVRILSWSDRISLLVDSEQWMEALALALDFYEGCAKGVVGLPRDLPSLQSIMGDRIVELVNSFLDLAMERLAAGATSLQALFEKRATPTTLWL